MLSTSSLCILYCLSITICLTQLTPAELWQSEDQSIDAVLRAIHVLVSTVHRHLGVLPSQCRLACRVKMGKWRSPPTMLVVVHQPIHQVLPGRFIRDILHEQGMACSPKFINTSICCEMHPWLLNVFTSQSRCCYALCSFPKQHCKQRSAPQKRFQASGLASAVLELVLDPSMQQAAMHSQHDSVPSCLFTGKDAVPAQQEASSLSHENLSPYPRQCAVSMCTLHPDLIHA